MERLDAVPFDFFLSDHESKLRINEAIRGDKETRKEARAFENASRQMKSSRLSSGEFLATSGKIRI